MQQPIFSFWALCAAGLSAFAQNGSATTSGEITIHTVTAGKYGQNSFVPKSLAANPGDTIKFQFYPSNHSVIRSEYLYPCVPIEDVMPGSAGFYSGFEPTAEGDTPPTWNLTINDTSPIFYVSLVGILQSMSYSYVADGRECSALHRSLADNASQYCGAPGSCIGYGMVGVINPNSSTQIDSQITLAKQASYMLEPGQPLPPAASSSMAAMASSISTVTITATPTNNPSPTNLAAISATSTASSTPIALSNKGLSSGAIAGIAVGGVAVLVLAGALFFFMGRSRTLKEVVDNQNRQSTLPEASQTDSAAFLPGSSRHTSQLPAYHQSTFNGQENKPTEVVGLSVNNLGNTRTSSPPIPYDALGQQYGGFQYDTQHQQNPLEDRQMRLVSPITLL